MHCFQIEDLSQQAQIQAADKFKTAETTQVSGEPASTVAQPITEESEEEEEVSGTDLNLNRPIMRNIDTMYF